MTKPPASAQPKPGLRKEKSVRPGIWGSLDLAMNGGKPQAGRAKKAQAKARPTKATKARPKTPRTDVWHALALRVDPAHFKPKLASDIEVKNFTLKWGNDYSVIANPRDLLHYRLEPGEVELLDLMDGTRTVKDIVIERFHSSGDLEMSGVVDLVLSLQAGSFLDPPFVDTQAALKRVLDPVSPARRKAREFLKTLRLEWSNADKLVRWIYNHFLKWFFNRVALVLLAIVAVTGFVAFIAIKRSGHFTLSPTSAAVDGLVILVLNYFLTFMHELGHATVMIHHGRRVKSAGFMIYFASPAFFVESSDSLMLDRPQRIAQSFAGPYAETVIAGLAAIVVWLAPGFAAAPILYRFAVINYFLVFLNLVPLLELDGYWILSDVIQVPDLRPRSLQFLRHDLSHKIKQRVKLTLQEWGLLTYSVVGVFFTVFVLYTGARFWHQIFGGLVSKLWHGGIVTRAILVVLGLLLGGPLIRGLFHLFSWVGSHLKAVWEQVRFKLETKWRVEAAELIDALPLFDDVPEDTLSELAGRVKLKTFRPGQAVVRQGERAEAFYVVRSGSFQVFEEDRETSNERVLRVLGRGEAFGELAVAQSTRRRATVKALEDSQVFEIDKSSFDRLLAEMLTVPEFAPSFQEMAELHELKCFSHLEQDELVDLMRQGEWITAAAGDLIIKQGETADTFYALHSGQVEVIENRKLVATMGPGSYFGEVGLLLHSRRTATVRALTPVRLYRLKRRAFEKLMRSAFKKGTLNPQAMIERISRH